METSMIICYLSYRFTCILVFPTYALSVSMEQVFFSPLSVKLVILID